MKCFFVLFIIIFTSCHKKNEGDENYKNKQCLELINSDSFIFFENGFSGQKLDVFINNEHYESRVLNTDPAMNLAGEIYIKSDTVNSITIVIDDVNIATFCPYPFIQVNNEGKKITIVVAQKPTPYQ